MTLNEFVKKWIDKGIDFDGRYSYQCVDLYRQYVKEVLGYPQSPGVVGAADIWTTYLKDYFTAIPNTPTGVPKSGDIVIWNKKMGGGYGHVAIVLSATVNSLEVFEQDGSINSTARLKVYKYTNVYGWLHPKVPSNQEPMPDTIPVKKSDFERLVSNSSAYDELVKRGITQQRFDELQRDLDGTKEALKALKTDTQNFIDRVASLLGSTADKEGIIKFATNLGTSLDQALEWKDKYEREVQEHKKSVLSYDEKLGHLDTRLTEMAEEHEVEIELLQQKHEHDISLLRQQIEQALSEKKVAESALIVASKFAGFWKLLARIGVK